MKRRFIIIAALMLLICAVTALSSCGQWDKPYDKLDEEGATVSVKFLAGTGGMFAGTNGVTVVDVFDVDDYTPDKNGKINISLLTPDDKRRGNEAFEITRTGHVLAGWYVTETVKNAQGEALDEDGNVASVSGKAPATTLRKWDFETDTLSVDASAELTGNEPSLTLTAMWVPYTNFEFYAEENGEFKKIGSYQSISLSLPEWDSNSGKLNYKNFPEINGKTFDKAYLDAEMTQSVSGKIDGKFEFSGSESTQPATVKVYTTWLDGEWYKISNASQLMKLASVRGCYDIVADLDFAGESWPSSLSGGTFRGHIKGNGHTVKGIRTTANITSSADVSKGAIFGILSEEAVITDLTFTDVTLTVKNAYKATDATFGILAGKNNGATLSGVSITSSEIILLKEFCSASADKIKAGDFRFGLLFAEGDVTGFDISGLSASAEDPEQVTISADANGILSFAYAE